MDRTQQTSVRQLFTQAEKLELQLPKPVMQAYARVKKIRAGIESMPAYKLGGIASAVAGALGRDADPLTDPEVLRAITLDAITTSAVLAHIEDEPFMQLWQVVDEYQDEVVIELRKPFNVAVAVLVAAHERIGDVALTDSDLILKKGGDIASVWAEAVAASKVIESIVLTWAVLDRFIHERELDRRWINLRIVNPPAETFDGLGWSLKTITAWDAVIAGVELSLPTRSEYTHRRAVLTEERAEIQAAALREPKRPSYR